jgi:hypothetical protein
VQRKCYLKTFKLQCHVVTFFLFPPVTSSLLSVIFDIRSSCSSAAATDNDAFEGKIAICSLPLPPKRNRVPGCGVEFDKVTIPPHFVNVACRWIYISRNITVIRGESCRIAFSPDCCSSSHSCVVSKHIYDVFSFSLLLLHTT